MKVSLESITPNAETNIVKIARVSSTREDKSEKPEGLINYLIKNNHWSPFQHSYLTFEIITSKAIAIQYLRHLSFTFQEFSQRYAEVNEMEPIEFRLQAKKNRQSSTDPLGIIDLKSGGVWWKDDSEDKFKDLIERVYDHLKDSFGLYQELINFGVAKETARFILPMSTSTKLYMTGSVRSWIHLLAIRDDEHAQKEAQIIAQEIKKIFKTQLPIISRALNY